MFEELKQDFSQFSKTSLSQNHLNSSLWTQQRPGPVLGSEPHCDTQRHKLVPDDGDKLGHGEFVRDQELGFVQRGQILLPLVALDDHLWGTGQQVRTLRHLHGLSPGSVAHTYRDFVGELGPDSCHFLFPCRCRKRRETRWDSVKVSKRVFTHVSDIYRDSSSVWTVCSAAGLCRAEASCVCEPLCVDGAWIWIDADLGLSRT